MFFTEECRSVHNAEEIMETETVCVFCVIFTHEVITKTIHCSYEDIL